ncbi:unnamed protein product [Penicillium glandicola]
MVATIIAARSGTAPIELYLMLQFMLGSFVTTLSTLGMRLWLMSPDRLAQLETTIITAFNSFWSVNKARLDRLCKPQLTHSSNSWWDVFLFAPIFIREVFLLLMALLKILSNLKPPELSWSGVTWRMTTAAVVAAYNLTFWFDNSGNGAQQPPRQGCGLPYIFLFSKQQLTGSIMTLGRTTSVIIVIFVLPSAVLLVFLTIQLWSYISFFMYRDILYFFNPDAPQVMHSALTRINALLERQGIPLNLTHISTLGLFNFTFVSLADVLSFFATPKGKAIRFSDVIKVCVSLGTGRVTKNETDTTLPMDGAGLMSGWKEAKSHHRNISSLWNFYVVLTIAWFIASIECTIHWNHIQGVNDLQTTGQLIPFIIGCVSASQVIKRLMLFAWAKKYPDWVDTELELEDGADGPTIFKIVKKDRGDDSEQEITRNDHSGNDQFERPIATMQTRRQSV